MCQNGAWKSSRFLWASLFVLEKNESGGEFGGQSVIIEMLAAWNCHVFKASKYTHTFPND